MTSITFQSVAEAASTTPLTPAIITALGSVTVGVLTLVGVLLVVWRTGKNLIRAEDRRHANAIIADRAQRYSAARYEHYVELSGTLARLIDCATAIREAPRSMQPPPVRIDPVHGETLDHIVDEIEGTLDKSYLLASDEVDQMLRALHLFSTGLWMNALVQGSAIEADDLGDEILKTTAAAEKVLAEAREARSMMRTELRSGV